MKSLLVSLLKPVAGRLFLLVNSVPASAALALFIVFLITIGVWVWTLDRERVEKAEDSGRVGPIAGDLRVWASVLLVIQIVIYIVLR